MCHYHVDIFYINLPKGSSRDAENTFSGSQPQSCCMSDLLTVLSSCSHTFQVVPCQQLFCWSPLLHCLNKIIPLSTCCTLCANSPRDYGNFHKPAACYYHLSTVEFVFQGVQGEQTNPDTHRLWWKWAGLQTSGTTSRWKDWPWLGSILMFVGSWLTRLAFFSLEHRFQECRLPLFCDWCHVYAWFISRSQQLLVFLQAFSLLTFYLSSFVFPSLPHAPHHLIPSLLHCSFLISPFFFLPAHRNSGDYFCLSHLPTVSPLSLSVLSGFPAAVIFNWCFCAPAFILCLFFPFSIPQILIFPSPPTSSASLASDCLPPACSHHVCFCVTGFLGVSRSFFGYWEYYFSTDETTPEKNWIIALNQL